MSDQRDAPTDLEHDPKKLLQSVMELGRQLDYVTSKCDTVEGLFTPELQVRRTKMKDLSVKLLLELSSKSCLLARERLWRSVCYDVMSRAKRLKRDGIWTPVQFWLIRNHLMSGIGLISYLVLRIQETPKFQKLNLRYFKGGILSVCPQSDGLLQINGQSDCVKNDQTEKWFEELLYHCLLNLGDLYRYLTEMYASDDEFYWNYYNLAQDFYTKAFFLNTNYGMAHNQLGNLNLKRNGGLDSTYYLLYSIISSVPYEGSYSNLRQFLDKQLVEFATVSAAAEWKPLDAFAFSFLSVIRQFLFETTRVKNFEKICQDTLLSFSDVLISRDPDLDKNMFMRASLIAIMSVWRLQAVDSANVSAAVALAMGVFFQLTDRLFSILNSHSHAPSTRAPSVFVETCEGCDEIDITLVDLKEITLESDDRISPYCMVNGKEKVADNDELIIPIKVKPKPIPLFRRRRRLQRDISSGGGMIGICYSSDEEDEYLSTPTYSGEIKAQGSSDGENNMTEESDSEAEGFWSEDDSDSERSNCARKSKSTSQVNQPAFEDTNSSNGLSDSPPLDKHQNIEQLNDLDHLKLERSADTSVAFVIDSEELMQCWTQVEPLLAALLPLTRWLQTTPAVTEAFASNCEKVFLVKLCKIMNLLKSINWHEPYVDMLGESNKVGDSFRAEWNTLMNPKEERKIDDSELFAYELPEDRSMLGLPNFSLVISDLKQNPELLKGEMMMTRIARMVTFGHWLSDTDSFALWFSGQENQFIVPTPRDIRRRIQNIKMNQFRDKLDGANSEQLEKLTQMWKAANPDHGKNFRRGRNNHGGNRRRIRHNSNDGLIYIFLDLPAVLNHFGTVKHLAMHPRFAIVLPHSVSKTLDILKESEDEGNQEARTASRWMETAGAKGYNEVRIQREHEKTRINATYPPDFTDESWEFFDVLESCNFLRTQELMGAGRPHENFFGDVRDKYRIFYLTGHPKILTSAENDFNPIEAARITSVFVDKITAYSTRRGRRRKTRNGKING